MARRKKKRKVLKNRKRNWSPGKVIRVSDEVYAFLDSERLKQSWDVHMRKLLGIPDRSGNKQPLLEGVLETSTGKFFAKNKEMDWETMVQDAYEVSIIEAAKKKKRCAEKPRRMRELP